MASTPEGLVKKHVQKALTAMKEAGEPLWGFYPVAGRWGSSGVCDYVGVYGGKFFAFEIKAPKGRPTALQLKCIESIKTAGGIATIIKPQEDKTIAEQVYEALGYAPK